MTTVEPRRGVPADAPLPIEVIDPRSGSVIATVPDQAPGEVADSVIVVPVDFAGLEHRAEQALPDVAWANP